MKKSHALAIALLVLGLMLLLVLHQQTEIQPAKPGEAASKPRASDLVPVVKKADKPETPTREPLGTFDVRLEAAQRVTLSPEREATLAEFKKQMAGVSVDFDPVTRSPKWIGATSRLLTEPGSPPRSKESDAVVRQFIEQHREIFGHGAAVLERSRRVTDYSTARSPSRKVVWHQQLDGIDLFEAVLQANLTADAALINIGSQMMPSPESAMDAAKRASLISNPPVAVEKAVAAAGQNIGENIMAESVKPLAAAVARADRQQSFRAAMLTDADAKLTWLPMSEKEVRLAWDVTLTSRSRAEMYRVLVDAENGSVLVRQPLTAYISPATYRVYTTESPTPFSPGHETPSSLQPAPVARTLVTTSAMNLTASPNGWINDGINITSGNNVDAYADTNNDNIADLPRTAGTPFRTFDFPFDLNQSPGNFKDASVTQLFYWNNFAHDRLYELGFTEAAGNFQVDNFGRGGVGNDPVNAETQDGGGTNNANFSTPVDGGRGRMQMYNWTYSTPARDSTFEVEILLHEYGHGVSNRLVGGPSVTMSSLSSRGMGEGWSDFYGLALTAESADNPHGNWAPAAWVGYIEDNGFTENYYYGLRRYSYSTDMLKNPLCFRDIDPTQINLPANVPRNPTYAATQDATQVHHQGMVWCTMLWEMRANLILKHGFTIGNERALFLVTEGMKLGPANPNFVQSRDGILQAVLVNYPADRGEVWAAFAKRGLGDGATAPSSTTTTGVVESYKVPDGLEINDRSGWNIRGDKGGAHVPTTKTVKLSNDGTSTLGWTASSDADWLSVSPASGQLAPGATASVQVTTLAGEMLGGFYSTNVIFTNVNTGFHQPVGVRLYVAPEAVLTYNLSSNPGWTMTGQWAYGTPTGSGGSSSGGIGNRDPSSGATGGQVFGVNLGGNVSTTVGGPFYLTSSPINLQLFQKTRLRFNRWLNTPDVFMTRVKVEVSSDGQNWRAVFVNPNTSINDSSWKTMEYDISSIADRQPNVRLRWSYENLIATSAQSGWNIDDIEILGEPIVHFSFVMADSIPENAGNQTATLRLSQALPTVVTATMTSSDLTAAIVPETIIFQPGEVEKSFVFTAVDDDDLDGTQISRILATAPGINPSVLDLSVTDNETAVLTMTVPASVQEGDRAVPASLQVSLPPTRDVQVTLGTNASAIQVPQTITLPAGQTGPVPFTFDVPDNAYAEGAKNVTLTATVENWSSSSAMILVEDDDAPAISLSGPTFVTEGDAAAVFTITVNTIQTTDRVIQLSTGGSSQITLPASVTIPAGTFTASFDVLAVDDTLKDGSVSVTLTAQALGYASASRSLLVRDNDLHKFRFETIPAIQVVNQPIPLVIRAVTVDDQVIPSFNGTVALSAKNGLFSVTLSPVNSGAFTAGQWASTATISMLRTNVVIRAVSGTVFGESNSFDVTAGPRLAVNPTNIQFNVPQGEVSNPQTLTLSNSGTIATQWSALPRTNIVELRPDLKKTLTDLNEGFASITDLIPNRYLFTDGVTGTNIPDGGNDMYDNGNYLGAVLTTSAPFLTYSDNAVVNTDSLGTGGRYYTRKHPGLFVFAADVAGLNYFEITGNLGANGSGSADSTVLSATRGGTVFKGFVKRVYGTSDPSVNHLIIVADNGSASHAISTNTNYDYHSLSNLTGVNRLYYLLYASSNGGYINNTQTQQIMEAFLDAILKGNDWLKLSSTGGSVPAAGSAPMVVTADSNILLPGTYPGSVQFSSNSTATPQPSVSATLNVLPAVQRFEWNSIPPLQQVNTPFTATLTAKDAAGNTVTAYQGRAKTNFVTNTTVTSGTGTLINTQLLLGSNLMARTQCIYSPQEVGEAGLISRLEFDAVTAPGVLNEFTVRMKHSPKSNYVGSASWESTGWTTVYSGALDDPTVVWNAVNLQNPFAYDGVSPLMVDISFQNTSAVTSGTVRATSVSPNRVISNSGTASPLSWSGTSPAANLTANLPNLRFTKKYVQPGSPAEVTMTNGVWTGSVTSALSHDQAFLEAVHPVRSAVTGMSNPFAVSRVGVLSLTLPASASESAGSFTATVTASVAPAANLTVSLSRSPVSEVTLPASVVIPAGQTSVNFSIAVTDDDVVDGDVNVTVSASAPAYDTATSQVTIQDDDIVVLGLTLPPSLTEGQSSAAGQASVQIERAALINVVVNLQSSLPSYLSVPATVTIPAGQTSAGFTITAPQNNKIEDSTWVNVTSGFSGAASVSAPVTILDDENRNLGMTLYVTSVSEGGAVVSSGGYVSISGTLTTPLVINLQSNDTSELLISPTVTIPAGSTISNVFALTPVNDADFDGSQVVTLTATADDFLSRTQTIIVRDDDVHHFGVSMASNRQVKNRPFTVTFTAQDVNDAVISSYTGSPTLSAAGSEGAVPLSPTSLSSFSAGVKTQSLTISEFASQVVITVTDPVLGISGSSQPFTVGSGVATTFLWSNIENGQPSGVPFPVTITAQDAEGNNVTYFNGNADLSIVSGVAVGSSETTWNFPLYSYYHDARTQSIYTAAELGGALIFNSLSLNISTLPGQSLNGFTIRLKHTSKNDFLSSPIWESSSWTVCHQSNQNITSTGWVTFPFSTPFSYNGTSNLMIDISFNNSFYTSNGSVYASQSSALRSIYAYSDSGQGDPLLWSGSSPSPYTSSLRPDIRLGQQNQVQVTLARTGSFSMGVWSGNIAISENVTDQRLRASTAGISGDSNVFSSGTPNLAIQLPEFISEGQGSFTGELGLTAKNNAPVTLQITSSDPGLIQPSSSTLGLLAGQKSLPITFNVSNDALKNGTRFVTLTLSGAGFSSVDAVVEVRDDELETLTLEPIPSPQIRNGPIPVILTARNAQGHVITSFQGAPALTALDGVRPLTVTPSTAGGFVQGVATIQAVIDDFATAAVITARLGDVETCSNAFAIDAGPVARFRWDDPGPVQIQGIGFPVSLTAEDAYGNIRTDYTGTAALGIAAQAITLGSGDSSTDFLKGSAETQSRTQQVYHASDLAQAGRIVSLTLNVMPFTGGGSTFNNFTVRLKHTAKTGFSTESEATWEYWGFTTVFQGNLQVQQAGPLELLFTTPFDFDGRSNLMIDLSFSGMTGSTKQLVASTHPAPYRTMSFQGSYYSNPLFWIGSFPTAVRSDKTVDVKLNFAPVGAITPAVTGAFENGHWNGVISVDQTSPALVLEAKGGSYGASNVLNIIPRKIPLTPEPAVTSGTTNRLYWEAPLPTGIEYELQRDITPGFFTAVSTGFIQNSSHLQTGLQDGRTYYYRLRMRGSGGMSWMGDWSDPVFSQQDATPPKIQLSAAIVTTTSSAAVISGTVSDDNGINDVFINQSISVTPKSDLNLWSHTLTNLPYGTSEVLVQARDLAEPPNLATLVVKVHRVINDTGTGAPNFLQEPRSQWAVLGQPVQWTTAVQGARPMTYAWSRNGKVLPELNAAEWTIPAVKISDVQGYRVTATNALGRTDESGPAWLGVVTPTSTPRVSVKTLGTVKLQCTATVPKGVEFIYRWKNGSTNLSDGILPSGASIAGSETAKLTISNITPEEAGLYTCQVTMRATGNPSITNGISEVSIATALPVITSTPLPAELWVSQSVHGYLTASHKPTQFIVKNLPKGLKLNPVTGLITGRLTTPSKIDPKTRQPIPYKISFSARNAIGPGPATVVSLIVKDHFGELAGTYEGLVDREPITNFRMGGVLKMTVAKTGIATGYFSLAGQRYAFTRPLEPTFDEYGFLTGNADLNFKLARAKPKGLGPLSVNLSIVESDFLYQSSGWMGDLQVSKLNNDHFYGVSDELGAANDTQAGTSTARFNSPVGLAINADGLVYVADSGNHTVRVMQPSPGLPYFTSTLAGTPGVSGAKDGTSPRFHTPSAITVGPDHAIYVLDQGSHTIRRIMDGVTSTLAGSPSLFETVDGLGELAGFRSPHSICADPLGNLYVTDDIDHVIRKITPAGLVTTFVGNTGTPGYVNATGAKARFNQPRGIVYDTFHKALFVTDGDKFIRRISLTGVVSTWSDRLYAPSTLCSDGRGAFYILTEDGIYRITSDKIIYHLNEEFTANLNPSKFGFLFVPQTNKLWITSNHSIQVLKDAIWKPWDDGGAYVDISRTYPKSRKGLLSQFNATLTDDTSSTGTGYIHTKIHHSGLVNSVGRLPDGSSVTSSSFQDWDGGWLMHQSLYNGMGSFQGDGKTSLSVEDMSYGSYSWRKNDPGKFDLPPFFETSGTYTGLSFSSPINIHQRLALYGRAPLDLRIDDLSVLPDYLILSAPNKWTIPVALSKKPISLKFKMDGKTGVYSGSFFDPETLKKIIFNGMVTSPYPESLPTLWRARGYSHIPFTDDNGVKKISISTSTLKPE